MKKSFIKNFSVNIIILSMLAVLFYVTNISYVSKSVTYQNKMPIYKGNENKKQVSLMINVYWGSEYIKPILNLLDKYNFKTTFFIGGLWAESNSSLLKLIDSKGHEIASHGYHHKDHKKLNYKNNFDEINMSIKLIKNIIGKDVKLFAPPSGSFSNDTIQACENLSLKTIMWSKDTIDWRDKDSGLVFTRATKNLSCGDLILAHPTKHTVEALDKIFSYYVSKGFSVVTVSNNIASDNI